MVSVLISTWTYPPQKNGVAHVAQAHAEGLAALGHKVSVVTGMESQRSPSDGKVKVIEFDVRGRWTPRTCFKPFSGDTEGYRRFIANYEGDVIIFHCCTVWNTDLILDLLPKISPKTILVTHGVSFNIGSLKSRIGWRLYTRRLYAIYRSFNHVVFLTEKSDRDRFFDKFVMMKRGLKNWSVIPNGAFIEDFKPNLPNFREAYGIEKNLKIILCVEAYSPMKNQEMALRAFLKLRRDDLILVFIGNEMNEYALSLQEAARRSRPNGVKVLFLSGLEDKMIHAAYKAAALFLHPSRTVAQPLVVLDAMASGTPFISTEVGCVSDFPGGCIVHTEEEMSEQIDKLLNDSEKMIALGESGLSACKEKYNWEQVASSYDDLINRSTT